MEILLLMGCIFMFGIIGFLIFIKISSMKIVSLINESITVYNRNLKREFISSEEKDKINTALILLTEIKNHLSKNPIKQIFSNSMKKASKKMVEANKILNS